MKKSPKYTCKVVGCRKWMHKVEGNALGTVVEAYAAKYFVIEVSNLKEDVFDVIIECFRFLL